VALTKIGFTLIKDNFKDAVSGSSTAHSSSFSTRVTTAETELGNTLLSGSAQISSNISGSLGTNATVIRNLSASIISGSSVSSSNSVSARVVSLEGSGTIQGVGTTDDVLFANITGSSVSASVGDFTTVNIDGGDINVSNLNSTNITGSVVSSSTALFTTATIDKIGGAIDFNNENMTNVDIDSGTITGITDLTVADGGTGVSTFTDGGVLLGSGTSAITAMAVLTDGQMIVGDGTTDPVAESGATLRTSIGVGTTNDVKFTNITGSNNISASGNLSITGNVDVDGTSNFAGDVTLQNDLVVTGRIDAEEIHTTFISSSIAQATGSTIFGDATSDSHQFTGSVDVSGSFTVRDGNVVVSDTLTATNIGAFTATGAIDFDNQNMTNVDIDSGVITGITDITVADGGTGVSTLTDGGVLLGNGAGAIQAMAVLTDGQMIVGDGTTDPVAESGATLRTSIGVGTGDDVVLTNLETSENVSGSFTSIGSFGNIISATHITASGNISSSGNLGADGDLYVGGRITGSSGATFVGNVGIGITAPVTNLHISEGTAGGETLGLTIENSDTSTSTDETVGLSFRHRGRIAGKIVSHRLDEYDNSGEASAGLKFFGVNSESYNLGLAIDHAGKVGIGTAAPGVKLDISGSGDQQLRIGSSTARAQLQFNGVKTTNAEFAELSFANAGDSVAGIQVHRQGANDQASMQFLTQAAGGSVATRMTISGSGNVGIGTTAPTAKLHVHDTTETGLKLTSTDSDFRIYADEGKDALAIVNTGDAVRFSLSGSGKFGFGKIPAGGHPNYAFYFSGSGMTANGSTGGALVETEHYGQPVMEVKGTSAQSNDAFGLRVQASNGTAWIQQLLDSAGNERFRFTGAGIFHTGGVFAAGNNAKAIDATAIESSRDSTSARTHMAFYNEDASNKGTITTSGDSTAFNTSSDYRWKENEITISDGLTRLNQLKPYRFNFKRFPDETLDGFFAHEVQSIVPHAVQGVKDEVDDDGKEIIQTLDHSKLVPLLVASVQELSEKVEEQAKRIEELEN